MQELQKTWVWSLGWEDPLEEGMATHLSFLAWRSPRILEWVAYPFSSGSSDPEIKSGPPALPFFTNWALRASGTMENASDCRSEEPGGLQSMGSQRVRHNWMTELSTDGICGKTQGELSLEQSIRRFSVVWPRGWALMPDRAWNSVTHFVTLGNLMVPQFFSSAKWVYEWGLRITENN